MVGQTVPHAIVAPAAALLTATDGITSMIVLDTDNKPHKQKVAVGIRMEGTFKSQTASRAASA